MNTEVIMNMGEHSGSNFWSAEKIGPNKKIQFDIAEAYLHDFDDGTRKPVLVGEDGSKLVMNPTRTKVLMAAWGPNSDNWLGRSAYISQGTTAYQGKPVPCIVVEPITHGQIENKPGKRGK